MNPYEIGLTELQACRDGFAVIGEVPDWAEDIGPDAYLSALDSCIELLSQAASAEDVDRPIQDGHDVGWNTAADDGRDES